MSASATAALVGTAAGTAPVAHASRAASESESEGEIFENDRDTGEEEEDTDMFSEKANTSSADFATRKGTAVDRATSRDHDTNTRDNPEYRRRRDEDHKARDTRRHDDELIHPQRRRRRDPSPPHGHHRSRSRNSPPPPPQSSRGEKRNRHNDRHDRHRDERDRGYGSGAYPSSRRGDNNNSNTYDRQRVSYADLDGGNERDHQRKRGSGGGGMMNYDDNDAGGASGSDRGTKRRRTRSRSRSRSPRYGRSRRDDNERERERERERRDKRQHTLANGASRRSPDLENRKSAGAVNGGSERQVKAKVVEEAEVEEPPQVQPLDENAEIERRRALRRERLARLQADTPTTNPATPAAVDNIASTALSTPREQSPAVLGGNLGKTGVQDTAAKGSAPSSPDTPASFQLAADPHTVDASGIDGEEEPSAADYDPTQDRERDAIRDEQRHHHEDQHDVGPESGPGSDNRALAAATTATAAAKKAEPDMFADSDGDEDDMFADDMKIKERSSNKDDGAGGVELSHRGRDVVNELVDNFDDPDGYYKVLLGEKLQDRYTVQSNLGKGMFSSVVRALDTQTQKLVAIKIVRNNDSMKRAGWKEIRILQELSEADKDDKKHVIRLHAQFDHKRHLCMVFENLHMNLREVIKKFGRDTGLNLKAVKAYAQQMFLALTLLKKCGIVHADLKPDNILVDDTHHTLKVCDLGSAAHLVDISLEEPTPYLVSRFYRAPEIILGLPYDQGIDMWAVGCTLFELYTGRILFTGRNNNSMLKSMMECRGRFPPKLLRRAQQASPQAAMLLDFPFDYSLDNFKSIERDPVTNKDVTKVLPLAKFPDREKHRDLPTRVAKFASSVGNVSAAEKAELADFVDLLDKTLQLNPEKRIGPTEALRHPFLMKRGAK